MFELTVVLLLVVTTAFFVVLLGAGGGVQPHHHQGKNQKLTVSAASERLNIEESEERNKPIPYGTSCHKMFNCARMKSVSLSFNES